jgi:hypothetical protein
MAYQFKSKTLQAVQANKAKQDGVSASEIAKMRVEIDRLKRKVEELTGERGDNPAVREKSFGGLFSRAFTSVGGLFGS